MKRLYMESKQRVGDDFGKEYWQNMLNTKNSSGKQVRKMGDNSSRRGMTDCVVWE